MFLSYRKMWRVQSSQKRIHKISRPSYWLILQTLIIIDVKQCKEISILTEEEQIKMEQEILISEYSGVRSEISSNRDAAHQLVSLTLTAAGVLIGGASYIIDSGATVVFLLAPLVFYGLAWTQVRYALIDD